MKNSLRLILFLLIIGLFLIDCENDVGPVLKDPRISISHHSSNSLFANLPVTMAALDKDGYYIQGAYSWDFGDKTQSSETVAHHTYESQGEYQVKLTISFSGGHEIVLDTTLSISPRLNIYGNRDNTEIGIFLYQNNDQEYNVLYSSESHYSLLKISSAFDSTQSVQITQDYAEIVFSTINSKGNLVLLGDELLEFDNNGTMLFHKNIRYGYSGRDYTEVTCTSSGYHIVSDSAESICLNLRDLSGESLSDLKYDVTKENFRKLKTQFEEPDILTIHYLEDNPVNTNNVKSYILKMRTNGEILYEKEYPDSQTQLSFNLIEGELLVGIAPIPDTGMGLNVFKKVDASGNVEWTFENNLKNEGLLRSMPFNVRPVHASVFEKEGFLYIFYDNMKGTKLDMKGNVIWSFQFSLGDDNFNTAIINHRGNFVLLGTHLFDYKNHEFTQDVSNRDLVLVEINKDGQYVY